jgi:hypothetical protein
MSTKPPDRESIKEALPDIVAFLRLLCESKPELVEPETLDFLDFATRNGVALDTLSGWVMSGIEKRTQAQSNLHLAGRR